MFALRNKKTGRLLTIEPNIEQYEDCGGWDITWRTYNRAILNLKDSNYDGVVFVTNDESVIKSLLADGKTTDPYHIYIIRNGFDRFNLTDLQIVKLEDIL